jgi:hypothetical protein
MKEDHRKKMGKVIAKAWTDPEYKKKLHSDPHAALAEAGITVPKSQKIRVLEDSADTVHVVVPARPASVTDQQLRNDEMHADLCKIAC